MTVQVQRRIAVNQIATPGWSFDEDLDAYARVDALEGVGVQRDKIQSIGAKEAAKRLRDVGLAVSSLSFIGGFTGNDLDNKKEDARRAIEEAHDLGAERLVVRAGGRVGISLNDANLRIQETLRELGRDSLDAGVQLALEPMHPMEVADQSTVVSIQQAYYLVTDVPGAGILLDLWHTWWDPNFLAELEQAKDDVIFVQVADWRYPNDNPRLREVPGNGVIPLPDMLVQVQNITGYGGWFEIDLFNDQYDASEYGDLVRSCVDGLKNAFPGQ